MISSLAVLADLAAPVGELADPAAQRFDRVRELLALALDVGADLGRAAPGGRRAARPARDRLAGAGVDLRLLAHRGSFAAGVVPDCSVCLIRLPSSIASSGVGGAPAWSAL